MVRLFSLILFFPTLYTHALSMDPNCKIIDNFSGKVEISKIFKLKKSNNFKFPWGEVTLSLDNNGWVYIQKEYFGKNKKEFYEYSLQCSKLKCEGFRNLHSKLKKQSKELKTRSLQDSLGFYIDERLIFKINTDLKFPKIMQEKYKLKENSKGVEIDCSS